MDRTIMSAPRFKYGLLRLAENDQERWQARRLAAAYIDADDEAKADCSAMLREDLKALSLEDSAT